MYMLHTSMMYIHVQEFKYMYIHVCTMFKHEYTVLQYLVQGVRIPDVISQ